MRKCVSDQNLLRLLPDKSFSSSFSPNSIQQQSQPQLQQQQQSLSSPPKSISSNGNHQNLWTKKTINGFRNLALRMEEQQDLYLLCEQYYLQRHYFLAISGILMGILASFFSIISTTSSGVSSSSMPLTTDVLIFQYIVSIIITISTAINAIQEYLQYKEKATEFKIFRSKALYIMNQIEGYLLIPIEKRANPISLLSVIFPQMEYLTRYPPEVPIVFNEYIRKTKYMIFEKEYSDNLSASSDDLKHTDNHRDENEKEKEREKGREREREREREEKKSTDRDYKNKKKKRTKENDKNDNDNNNHKPANLPLFKKISSTLTKTLHHSGSSNEDYVPHKEEEYEDDEEEGEVKVVVRGSNHNNHNHNNNTQSVVHEDDATLRSWKVKRPTPKLISRSGSNFAIKKNKNNMDVNNMNLSRIEDEFKSYLVSEDDDDDSTD